MKKDFCSILMITFSVTAFSKMPRDYPSGVTPLDNGKVLDMDIKVQELNARFIKIKNIINRGPTVLVFYRGGWCPYCNIQLSGLRKITNQLKKCFLSVFSGTVPGCLLFL